MDMRIFGKHAYFHRQNLSSWHLKALLLKNERNAQDHKRDLRSSVSVFAQLLSNIHSIKSGLSSALKCASKPGVKRLEPLLTIGLKLLLMN